MRRLVVGVLMVVAALLFAQVAQAETAWFFGGARLNERSAIAEGESAEVPITGPKIKFAVKRPRQILVRFTCKAEGVMRVWNEGGHGFNEISALSFSACVSEYGHCLPTVLAPLLPWNAELLGTVTPLRDEYPGVSMQVACGPYAATVTGTIPSQAGDNDAQGEVETEEEADNFVQLGKSKTEPAAILSGPAALTVNLVGRLNLGTKTRLVTAEVH
jgi:hypothetical protein